MMIAIRSVFILCLLCSQLSYSAAAQTPFEQLKRAVLTQQTQKPDDYFFKLLGIQPTDLANRNTPEQLAEIIEPALQAKINLIPEDEPTRPALLQALESAKRELSHPVGKKAYTLLGHALFASMAPDAQEIPGLFNYFAEQMATDPVDGLKKILQMYSYKKGHISEPIAAAFTHMGSTEFMPIDDVFANALEPIQQRIYRALGPEAYQQFLSDSDEKKSALAQFVQDNNPSLQAIVKQRIMQTFATISEIERAAAARQKDEADQTKRRPRARQPKADQTTGAAPVDAQADAPPAVPRVQGRAPENIAKATSKVESALRSLNNAKRAAKKLSRDKRQEITKAVEKILKDNEPGIKNMMEAINKIKADGLQTNPDTFPALERFADSVKKIYDASKF